MRIHKLKPAEYWNHYKQRNRTNICKNTHGIVLIFILWLCGLSWTVLQMC